MQHTFHVLRAVYNVCGCERVDSQMSYKKLDWTALYLTKSAKDQTNMAQRAQAHS